MQVTLVVGIDVGKQEVMVASSDGVFAPRKVANQDAPLRAWLKSLPAGTLIGIDGGNATYRLPPPRLGEHTNAVLKDWLGYDGSAIAQLRAQKLV